MDEKRKKALMQMAAQSESIPVKETEQEAPAAPAAEPAVKRSAGKKKAKHGISITLDTEDLAKLKKLSDFIYRKNGKPSIKSSRIIRAALKYAEANDAFMEKYEQS